MDGERAARLKALGFVCALTVGSGALYALAFPPTSWRPVAWLALAPFFFALRRVGPGAAAGLAWLWTIAACAGVANALPTAVEHYFLQPKLVGFAFAVGVWTLTGAVYYVPFAWTARRVSRLGPLAGPVLVGAAWAFFELLRGRMWTGSRVFTGNPWALVAYSQVGWHELVQVASLGGPYAISFLVAWVNAALVELAATARGRDGARRALLTLAAPAIALAAALVFGRFELARAERASGGTSVPIAVVQGNLAIGSTWRSDYYGRNLETYLELTAAALFERPAVVVWPESALTFFLEDEPAYRRAIARVLAAGDVELVTGGPRRASPDGSERYTNSVWVMAPSGALGDRYDKQELVPFAEFFPLADLDFLRRRFERVRVFERGETAAPIATRAGRAGVLICNEAMLPELARERARSGAELLIVPSNDTWVEDAVWAELMFDLVSLRAVEQRRWLVRASTSGPSAVVDPWGRVQARAGTGRRELLRAAVEPRQGLSVYGRSGDAPTVLAGLAAIAAALARPRPAAA